MLHLYFSRDRKQNTETMLERVCALARDGVGGQFLLVPEQFSHMAERRLCERGGDSISRFAEVLGFSRLAARVFSEVGGVADTETDAAGRLLMMSLTVEQIRSRLKIYGNCANKPSFLLKLLKTIDELQSFCVTTDALRLASQSCTGVLAVKAEELALLMEGLQSVSANLGQNPESRLNRLLFSLEQSDFAKKKYFYFDGFTDFNGVELQIIEQLLCDGAEVSAYLHCDSLDSNAQQYSAARDTAKKLMRLAQKQHVSHEIVLAPSQDGQMPFAFLRENIFRGGKQTCQDSDSVMFLDASERMSECRMAAGEILKLLEQGCRLRDITIACADYAAYRPVLETVLRRAEIPAYFAGDTDILRQPVVHMLLSALQAAESLEQEPLLRYLKSGFVPLTRDRCDRLENYILLWDLHGARLEQPWKKSPSGMENEKEERKQERLAQLNEDRQTLMAPLSALRNALRSAVNTGQMLLALAAFMEDISLNERLNAMAAQACERGALQKAQEYAQVYEIICNLMEQMYGILGQTSRSAEEFILLFRTAASLYTVGTIPATLDCISVGSLSSQRRSDSDYLFLLGANEGVFPAIASATSLLTDAERGSLKELGLSVSPMAAERMDREIAMMDSVLCVPSKRFYLGASNGRASYYVQRAKALFPQARICREDTELIARCPKEYKNRFASPVPYEIPDLSDGAVQALYGKTLRLSSSKIDVLASCRFAYFLQYGLKAKERKQAKVDASLYGTFVHDVLERTTKQVQMEGGFAVVSLERVLELADGFMERYASEELAELWDSERAEYLFRRTFSEVRAVIRQLYEELSVCAFAPKWFELSFANHHADLPTVKIVGKRMTAELEGKVDRADVWSDGTNVYVRVVDYKTGKKSFDYTKIFYGIGMQMLLYLFALRRMGEPLLSAPLRPAGVLYFPARVERVSIPDKLDTEEMQKKRRASERRSGLLLEDDALLWAMEPSDVPRFLPFKYDKSGNRKGDLATREQLAALENFVFSKVAELADDLYSGALTPNPYADSGSDACKWCPYSEICRNRGEERWAQHLKAEEFWSILEGGETDG